MDSNGFGSNLALQSELLGCWLEHLLWVFCGGSSAENLWRSISRVESNGESGGESDGEFYVESYEESDGESGEESLLKIHQWRSVKMLGVRAESFGSD